MFEADGGCGEGGHSDGTECDAARRCARSGPRRGRPDPAGQGGDDLRNRHSHPARAEDGGRALSLDHRPRVRRRDRRGRCRTSSRASAWASARRSPAAAAPSACAGARTSARTPRRSAIRSTAPSPSTSVSRRAPWRSATCTCCRTISSDAEAALIEPLACVINGQNKVESRRAIRSSCSGAGPIGTLHIKLARAARGGPDHRQRAERRAARGGALRRGRRRRSIRRRRICGPACARRPAASAPTW